MRLRRGKVLEPSAFWEGFQRPVPHQGSEGPKCPSSEIVLDGSLRHWAAAPQPRALGVWAREPRESLGPALLCSGQAAACLLTGAAGHLQIHYFFPFLFGGSSSMFASRRMVS